MNNPTNELDEFEKETANVVPKKEVLSVREKEYEHAIKDCVFKSVSHQETRNQHTLDKPRLYTVTTIARSDLYGGTRTPGIFTTFEKAKEVIEGNFGDIWEFSYMFALIEAIEPDRLYGWHHELYWYVWKGDQDGGYKAIETPEMYKQTCGFGIG